MDPIERFLPVTVAIPDPERFILFPYFVVPVELFTRGLLSPPRYDYLWVLVNAVTGQAEERETRAIRLVREGPGGTRIQPRIGPDQAAPAAENAAASGGRRGWGLMRGADAYGVRRRIAPCRRVWALQGGVITDTYTGRALRQDALLGTLLGGLDACEG
ncbi:MAG: hypothetical protein K9L28_11415 [Synergistales bacterium]|nr:hypothetical protein [Synergistales bacterium]